MEIDLVNDDLIIQETVQTSGPESVGDGDKFTTLTTVSIIPLKGVTDKHPNSRQVERFGIW